ncbi:MAG: hypothetical protein KDK90_25490 [Leptospiraceae bacterium]|nr:hypothetical protein [Leptospiraceae bacterium]
MKKVIQCLENDLDGAGIFYKSFKYCHDEIRIPGVVYDNDKEITVAEHGETDKGLKTSKSLEKKSKKHKEYPPLFKYFLDGSRRTYKIDDVAYDNRIYPIIAGQIGVGSCIRRNPDIFKATKYLENNLVLSLPRCLDTDGKDARAFFDKLKNNLNNQEFLKKKNLYFSKILDYDTELLKKKEGENYENRGIAKIQDEMVDLEKKIVEKLVKADLLNQNNYLLKDGSLEYSEKGVTDKSYLLSVLKNNYRCVVGVSKSFDPELFKDARGKSNAKSIAELEIFHRTPAYMMKSGIIKDVSFSIWYLRIRKTQNPFEGVLKIEKILLDQEIESGLNSDEVDTISANIINERNPTCYGKDNRWANHIYPVYLTESFIKSRYLSDIYFLNLF